MKLFKKAARLIRCTGVSCKAKHWNNTSCAAALSETGWTKERAEQLAESSGFLYCCLKKERKQKEKNGILQTQSALCQTFHACSHHGKHKRRMNGTPPLRLLHLKPCMKCKNQPVSSEITSSTRQRSGVKTSHRLETRTATVTRLCCYIS